MCFSAEASFTAGGVLTLVGAACLRVSDRHNRWLALMPLAFALQ
jgi:hypothetical protein